MSVVPPSPGATAVNSEVMSELAFQNHVVLSVVQALNADTQRRHATRCDDSFQATRPGSADVVPDHNVYDCPPICHTNRSQKAELDGEQRLDVFRLERNLRTGTSGFRDVGAGIR